MRYYLNYNTVVTMGCGQSKGEGLQTVDDSVHVMLKHDKQVAQSKGQAPKGYVPRAPHPLLQQQQQAPIGEAPPGESSGGPPPASKPIVATEDS